MVGRFTWVDSGTYRRRATNEHSMKPYGAVDKGNDVISSDGLINIQLKSSACDRARTAFIMIYPTNKGQDIIEMESRGMQTESVNGKCAQSKRDTTK